MPVTTMYIQGTSGNTFPEFAPVSENQVEVVLVANKAQIISVPGSTKFAVFNADGGFYCSYNGDNPEIPGDYEGQRPTRTEFNPAQKSIAGYTTLAVIAKELTHLHISFYS